jgi:hypothetical protein
MLMLIYCVLDLLRLLQLFYFRLSRIYLLSFVFSVLEASNNMEGHVVTFYYDRTSSWTAYRPNIEISAARAYAADAGSRP